MYYFLFLLLGDTREVRFGDVFRICFAFKWHILVVFEENNLFFNDSSSHVCIFKEISKITCEAMLERQTSTAQNRSNQ